MEGWRQADRERDTELEEGERRGVVKKTGWVNPDELYSSNIVLRALMAHFLSMGGITYTIQCT